MKWTQILLLVAVCSVMVAGWVDSAGFLLGPGCRRRCREAGMVYVGRLNGMCFCTDISKETSQTQQVQLAPRGGPATVKIG